MLVFASRQTLNAYFCGLLAGLLHLCEISEAPAKSRQRTLRRRRPPEWRQRRAAR